MSEQANFLNKMRLLTPGPTQLPEDVRLALALDMIHHRKAEFFRIMEETQKDLRILFGTENPVLPLSSSGTGAMTAAVYSLFSPGEKVLVIEAGKFGQRWSEICRFRDLEVISLGLAPGQPLDLEALESLLERNPDVKGVLAQICETSTGALLPIRAIASLTTKRDCLCIADGISAVGVSPCPMDEWQIDCLLTGSQKGLMLPPGLALIALSEKAWAKAANVRPGCYYFDLVAEKKGNAKHQTHFTTPVNLIIGLKKSLDLLLKAGLDEVYRKQWALTMLVRAGAEAMGLSPFAKQDFSWGVTAINLPENINGSQLLSIMKDDYGIIMAGGQDNLKNKIIRLGHMGWVDWSDCLAGLMAIAGALKKLSGKDVASDFAAAAMSAYQDALTRGYPRQ